MFEFLLYLGSSVGVLGLVTCSQPNLPQGCCEDKIDEWRMIASAIIINIRMIFSSCDWGGSCGSIL